MAHLLAEKLTAVRVADKIAVLKVSVHMPQVTLRKPAGAHVFSLWRVQLTDSGGQAEHRPLKSAHKHAPGKRKENSRDLHGHRRALTASHGPDTTNTVARTESLLQSYILPVHFATRRGPEAGTEEE